MNTEATRAAFQRFPHETLIAQNDVDADEIVATGNTFLRAVTVGVLWSLGAESKAAVLGAHQMGGLLFIARILPFRHGERRERAARMAVMISLNPADTIDIQVIELASGREHARTEGVYIDQLSRAVLALDYDGEEPFNPRYWTN